MQLKNMNIKKMHLALLANASFVPYAPREFLQRNKLLHRALCTLSSIILIESTASATSETVHLNFTPTNPNEANAAKIENAWSAGANSANKTVYITTGAAKSVPFPVVSTANHTNLGPTILGANLSNNDTIAALYVYKASIGSTSSIGAPNQSFTIRPQATLSGNGTIQGNVSNAGKVSPGNNGVTNFVGEPSLPVGTTMSVAGSYTSTGQTWLYFSPTTGDKIAITGAFDPSTGTLYITPKPGYYPSSGTLVTHDAITWAGGATSKTWGYGATEPLPAGIVVTTATPGSANYLELNVTATQTSTGLAFTFAGVDKNLSATTPVDPATLKGVTGQINAANGTTIQSTSGEAAPIETKFEVATGGTANIQPAENSTVEFKGEVAGGNLNLSSAASGSTVKFTSNSPSYTGTVAATGVKAIFNGNMNQTAINAGAGATIGGSGSVGAVTANGATLKPGNSVGTSTYASLNATSTTHYQVEMNSTAANNINVTGNANLGTDFIVDVLMDTDTYTSATYPIMTVGGTLTGNVNTLTWTDQSGLLFDIGLDATTKTISLISTISSPITISADQTTAGTKKRRIITSTSETAASLNTGAYDYVTLINGTLTNTANNTTITTPISISGSSTITPSTTGYTTTLAGALNAASGSTLHLTNGVTVITADSPNFLGTLAVGSGATLSLGSSASFNSTAQITLAASTLQLPNGMTLLYPISSSGISTINTTGTTTLNGTLSNANGTTLKLTGGTTTINSNSSGLSGTLQVQSSTLYLGSSAILGSGTLSLTSATLHNSSSNLASPSISASSSTINVDADKNLGSGALSLSNSTINFLSGGTGTTTLTNSGFTLGTGTSTFNNNVGSVHLGSGALSGAGTLSLNSANPSNITYITASNSSFTGAVNISSKVNIGNGSNLGTTSAGLVTLNSGAGLTFGNVTLSNAFNVASASSFTVNPSATTNLTGSFSGSAGMSISSPDGTGILKFSGTSTYSGAINATNINLLMNGSSNAPITAGANTVLSGSGSAGAISLNDTTAAIQPGIGGYETLTISSLSISGAEPHLYILVGPNGERSKLKIIGGAAGANGATPGVLENLTVDILYAGGTHPQGTMNYPFLLGDGSNAILSKVKKITWPTQTGISFSVGFDTNGQLIAQSTVQTGGVNITPVTSYLSANRSESTATGLGDARLTSINSVNYGSETNVTAIISDGANVATTPINLNNNKLTNNTSGTTTLYADFAVTGTSEINNAASTVTTAFQTPISVPSGATLKITGAGITTFSNDTNNNILGNIEISNSSTVNVTNGLGSGAVSLADTSKIIVKNGAILNNPVAAATGTTVELQPISGQQSTVNSVISGAGAVKITTTGTGRFTQANPLFTGPVTVGETGVTAIARVDSNANLGTGTITLIGTNPTVSMGNVILPNPISATVASTFTSDATTGEKSVLRGAITGNASLTFTGTGTTEIGGTDAAYSSPAYTGTLNAESGQLKLNSSMSFANVNVGGSGMLSGVGTMKDLVLSTGGKLKPGNSIGTTYVTGNYTAADQAIYLVEIAPDGRSNRIVVTGDATLSGTHIIKPLLNAGTYPTGVIEYNILQAGGTLTVNNIDIKYVTQAGPANLTFSAGKLGYTTGTAPVDKTLVLRYENTGAAFTINADQVEADTDGGTTTSITTPSPINIAATDIVSSDSGLRTDIVPVVEQVELTGLVFQSNASDITSTATADAFQFKGFSSGTPTAVSGKKNTMEAFLTALSKNGPVSYERNETRLWVSPFTNRSRTNRTSSDLGNQGWSGGSLIGLEQRDKKNIWSTGILTGLMGSRSHVLGTPDTFSKTTGFLIGAFNTYKYTKKWGHELLISRTNTFIDSQRYGLDSTDNKTPYYAISNYKSTTDVGNAQINYLFNIIKKKITCRLNTGITYIGSQTGKIIERNAGTNSLMTTEKTSKSVELYNGIGLRRIWQFDQVMIRTTAVYEYGYQLSSTGSMSRTTTLSAAQTSTPIITGSGPRQNKHYLQLNSSYLDRGTGLKFILAYSGSFYKNVRGHTGMAKVEYRF